MEAITSTEAAKILFNYGVLGVVVVAMAAFIIKLMRDHKAERKELAESLTKQNDTMVGAFEKNTTVLTEVKTLIQTIAQN